MAESDTSPKTLEKGISTDDLKAAFSGPALAANKIFASNTQHGIRLTFCENGPEGLGTHFRSAVFLSYPDVRALRDLLEKQLAGVEFVEVKPEGKTSNA